MSKKISSRTKDADGAAVGHEDKLWEKANALRGSMDAAEYRNVVLGLVFLKHISDAFEEKRLELESQREEGADPDDPDEYLGQNVFWVPAEARWSRIKAQARQPEIGKLVDDAMAGIERGNAALKDILPKQYGGYALDDRQLGRIIDLVGSIKAGNEDSLSKDVSGRVYEYFLSQFASSEGKKGGEFYTPRCIVKLLVEMLEPYEGRVYDPCCGSSGMFVQSVEFINAHAGRNGSNGKKLSRRTQSNISIYGQELNHATWRIAKMNLAIRGIAGQIEQGDSFRNNRHPDLKADFVLANPPFNSKNWGIEHIKDSNRWKYGIPPKSNANYAWLQHIVHHLAPGGAAGVVLANGSMSSTRSGEGEIRKNLIEAEIVDCMVALPGQLFYSTPVPACLWFLARNRKNGKFRDRRNEILFIDARMMGNMADRTHRELTDENISLITDTYHAWRDKEKTGKYADVPGFCKSASLDEVRNNNYVLAPGQYAGFKPREDDGELFDDKMNKLTAQLREQFTEAHRLEKAIEANLNALGFGNREFLNDN